MLFFLFLFDSPFFLSFFPCFLFLSSRWSFVDVPLIFFSCPADHVSDLLLRILLGMVEARSVNVKNTHNHTHSKQKGNGNDTGDG